MASSPIEVEDKFKIMRHKSQWGSRDLCKGNTHRGKAAEARIARTGRRFVHKLSGGLSMESDDFDGSSDDCNSELSPWPI